MDLDQIIKYLFPYGILVLATLSVITRILFFLGSTVSTGKIIEVIPFYPTKHNTLFRYRIEYKFNNKTYLSVPAHRFRESKEVAESKLNQDISIRVLRFFPSQIRVNTFLYMWLDFLTSIALMIGSIIWLYLVK